MDTPNANLYNIQLAEWPTEPDLSAGLTSPHAMPEAAVAAMIMTLLADPRLGQAAVKIVTSSVPVAVTSYTLTQSDNDTYPGVKAFITKTREASRSASMMPIIMNCYRHINIPPY